jgi:hypothetical protein
MLANGSTQKFIVAIRRLIDPNPREVTEADATRIYRAVLEPAWRTFQ